MKTNVSIKINSIEEYREIESKLVELGYEFENTWNTLQLIAFEDRNKPYYVFIDKDLICSIYSFPPSEVKYNLLQDFLNNEEK